VNAYRVKLESRLGHMAKAQTPPVPPLRNVNVRGPMGPLFVFRSSAARVMV
jgi:hypothetical protein